VPKSVLEQYGAVSQQTVEAMAKGAAENANANLAIAVSGIAGPGGGTAEKPVGTVWIAIYCTDLGKSTVWSQCFQFTGDRKEVRQKTVESALLKALEFAG
jgi:nicotinamide-nucleotide amidase